MLSRVEVDAVLDVVNVHVFKSTYVLDVVDVVVVDEAACESTDDELPVNKISQ